ncbi:unnamed protein product [Microthlaspi erraticum]|uniref:F-box associated beta-propeller type 1 domain-containing protein n=1 Tax=Microthlaspi erraticum TaxID=1685480 RepID=A0A6D2I585_9BRAS|nr:unnamed protein product [Microthlaspi erraticum]CAA7034228.1 unnamed protein product [Microthlaspi erraticum]CAA7044029.1 unnamed protein product [Microthlaspi erraticum]
MPHKGLQACGMEPRKEFYMSDNYSIGYDQSNNNYKILRERFGPRLYLPFDVRNDMQTLSSVREEKISVMLMRKDTNVMEVWITDKIEPDAASWKKFMVVKDQPILSRIMKRFGKGYLY